MLKRLWLTWLRWWDGDGDGATEGWKDEYNTLRDYDEPQEKER